MLEHRATSLRIAMHLRRSSAGLAFFLWQDEPKRLPYRGVQGTPVLFVKITGSDDCIRTPPEAFCGARDAEMRSEPPGASCGLLKLQRRSAGRTATQTDDAYEAIRFGLG